MKKLSLLLIFGLLIHPFMLPAQCLTFSSANTGYDYGHINRGSYTYAFPQGTAQDKFHYSVINICNQLADLAQNYPFGTQKQISLGSTVKFKASKLAYTPFQVQANGQSFPLRMIFIRPNDNVLRPCVMLSLGGGADLDNWYNYLAIGIADYVSRGYAVALYENYNNKQFMQSVGDDCQVPATNMPVFGHPELPFYGLYQFARAAVKCVVGQAGILKINPEWLFAGGYSAGGFSSYALALADENNFSDPLFITTLGDRDDKVFPQWKNQSYSIKGIGIMGSGLFLESPLMGQLADESDAGLAAVLWHGGADPLVHTECCDAAPCSGPCTQEISLCGAVTVGEYLQASGIHTQVYVNCPGGHTVWHRILSNSQTSGTTFPLPSLNIAVLTGLNRELQQLTSMQNQITAMFKAIITNTALPEESVQSYQPVHYPNPLGSNWSLCPTESPCLESGVATTTAERDFSKVTENEVPVIYPNPTNAEVFIRWQKDGIITITDATARTLAKWEHVTANTTVRSYSFPAPGIYTVMCCNEAGCFSAQIVITR